MFQEAGGVGGRVAEAEHDDLVLAAALACWAAKKRHPDLKPGEASYWTREGEVVWGAGK